MADEVEATERAQATEANALSEFDIFSRVVVSTMKEVAQLADNGVSNFLLGLGTAIFILAISLKLRPFGVQVSDLTPTVIAVIVFCALLLLFGAYLRLYQYQKDREISRTITEAGTRLLEKSVDSSARIQEKGVEAAAEMTKQQSQPKSNRI
jgi:hypothetical protein